jgi:hypothetical protein
LLWVRVLFCFKVMISYSSKISGEDYWTGVLKM